MNAEVRAASQGAQVDTIASKLNIFTLQGVAVTPRGYAVPTLDGTLLQITAQGGRSTLADLQKADLGIPFSVVEQQGSLVLTTSDYLPRHFLVQVSPTGIIRTIADLSDVSGGFGAPFGVAVSGAEYVVTLSPDVTESSGLLIRVKDTGAITEIADVSGFGKPFGVVVQNGEFVVAQQTGHLLRVRPDGKVSPIVDLAKAGFGIPFGVAAREMDLFVTTNTGLVVRVKDGTPTLVVNLLSQKLGIPSGIAVSGSDLIVTTNSGYLLRVRLS
ncbi:hypothetical protein H6F43_20705 [Leptolyngbya sp. FACHB-36]|uniref:hypothetical protein n=1 Tax=Leptolyngbya sp. FACHB-36 TaxID=2692808 RepID=UPI001681433B|nr:hypothetical protein [Leptolyngbya sp. FACHB-36]MBD2022607.1 hypothetical protein [Leptolyngbya sp. FACHB-36]